MQEHLSLRGAIKGSFAATSNEEQCDSLSCSTCGKIYTRLDHLVRHQRSHSDSKPFPCTVCGKEFARVDVLKRHLTNHEDNGPVSKRRRKLASDGGSRVARACRSCAAAKLKCEEEKPCQRCRQKQIECVSSIAAYPPGTDGEHPSGPGQEQDYPYEEFPIIRNDNHALSGLDPHQMPTSTMPWSAVPTGDPDRSFLGSVSQLHSASAAEAANDASTLTSQAVQQRDEEIIDFSTDLSLDFDESSLAYFLNGIMIPPVPDYDPSVNQAYQARTPKDLLDFGTFNIDSFDMDVIMGSDRPEGMTLPSDITTRPPPVSGMQTPSFRDRIASGNAAFMRSVWMWTPGHQDFGGKDTLDLSLPPSDMDSPETRSAAGHSRYHQFLDNAMRDKILGFVLSTCDSSLFTSVASSFPNADLLNKLMHLYMAMHDAQKDSWLHLPTMELGDDTLLLVIIMISAGAVVCSVSSIRRLGYALQEAVRNGLARRFENDNRATRDLSTLQAFALKLQIGLWSGDKRKMELAESFAQPLITMLRRAGRFRRPKNYPTIPTIEDSDNVLHMKWSQWAHAESYKRLACHLLIHDAQASMACQVAPLLSPTEFSLAFPVSKQLWSANSAQEWRTLYLQSDSFSVSEKGLSISQGINSVSQLRDQHTMDLGFATNLVLHSTWAIVYSSTLLNSLTRLPSVGLQQQETPSGGCQNSSVVHLMEQILINLADWEGSLPPDLALVSERTLLNLHLSFEQVQVFAGREGEEEARRAFPILQRWAESSDARKAIWHAGQILKAARLCPATTLREFGSICVYHAGLTFWAYAVLTAVPTKSQGRPVPSRNIPNAKDTVWLDGEDVPAVQRFISLNRGTPVVRDTRGRTSGSISPSNPKALMEVCISLLRRDHDNFILGDDLPLVDNLNQLMRDLGSAAHGLLSGNLRRSVEHQQAA